MRAALRAKPVCRGTGSVGAFSLSYFASSRRGFTSSVSQPHVCVVGAGPAGFYTIEYLLKSLPDAKIDLYERWPCPYGLVRFGVAPDHPEVKVVANKFEKFVTDNPQRVQFVGNVNVGSTISIEELRKHYHAIVLSYGADEDRLLGVPGENLRGVHSAREFVAWYNGEPSFADARFDLSCESAVVIGQGNVALDVARILLAPVEELAKTDITLYALEALKKSKVKEVHIVGRRGPAQASFTNKELREILDMKDCKTLVQPADALELNAASLEETKAERGKKRMIDLLKNKITAAEDKQGGKKVVLHYLKSPVRLLSGQAKDALGAIETERNRLEGDAGNQRAVGTGLRETLPCGLVFRSIGYKSVGIAGLPFDEKKGVIPNREGRVVEKAAVGAAVVPGVYVSGWVKRGPSGVIGTNRMDAEETVSSLCADLTEGKLPSLQVSQPGLGGISPLLATRGAHVVDFGGWKKVEGEEEGRGKASGTERTKITSVAEMLRLAANG